MEIFSAICIFLKHIKSHSQLLLMLVKILNELSNDFWELKRIQRLFVTREYINRTRKKSKMYLLGCKVLYVESLRSSLNSWDALNINNDTY